MEVHARIAHLVEIFGHFEILCYKNNAADDSSVIRRCYE